jgi:HD-like signal output (HDOD) protein
MGLNKMKTLIIACGIVSSVPDLVGFDIKRFWLHSFNTATYAQQLAKEAKLNADIAYTAGLISGLGNVLIHMAYPKEAAEIDQHFAEIDQHLRGGKPSYEIEQRRLGFTSFEACAELCRRWHFSDELVTTVANSGNPLAAETPSKLACTVFVARYLSDCSQNDLSLEETVSGLAGDVSTQLGIGEESAADKLQTIMALESNLAGLLD